MTANLGDLRAAAILDKLEKARARKAVAQPDWPDAHLIGKEGKPVPFHEAQMAVWNSERRTVALTGGSQAGKTSMAPWWMKREIQARGRGDYLAVTSSFDLFRLKMLPELLRVFVDTLKWGRYWAGDQILELRDLSSGQYWATRSTDSMWGRVILRSAQSLGGLESATAKAALLDEAGQDEFPVEAYRAIQRRLALNKGRQLITTTLYNLGWVYSDIVLPAQKTGIQQSFLSKTGAEIEIYDSAEADIILIQCDSTVNPEFPREEYERAENSLPPDQFAMFYRGRVVKPRHLIYDCFDENTHKIPRFTLGDDWPRYIGMDFGGINTYAVFIAKDPSSGKFYAYREYKRANRTAAQHVEALMEGEVGRSVCYGGAGNEDQWRREFREAGLPVKEPKISDVWLGINATYGEIKAEKLYVFDDLPILLNDLLTYRRRMDNTGAPTEEIFNKNAYHAADALRYVIGSLSKRTVGAIAFV